MIVGLSRVSLVEVKKCGTAKVANIKMKLMTRTVGVAVSPKDWLMNEKRHQSSRLAKIVAARK